MEIETPGMKPACLKNEVTFAEHKKKAFDGAIDLTKLLITLATGTLALTGTFIKDILRITDKEVVIPYKWLLIVTWTLMGLSIFLGLLTYAAITGTLDGADTAKKYDNKYQLSVFNSNIARLAATQSIIFYLGIVALILYISLSL